MLMVFFAVALFDVVVVSLLTGQLRFWFPVWLDPQWATRPDAWVTYSQSYFAGILLIPYLLRSVDRELIAAHGGAARGAFWVAGLGAFGFILWWKGGLMVEHDKEWEALAWAALTALCFGLVLAGEVVPRRVASISRAQMLRGLLYGVSGFFLVMAVLDPAVQLGVQGLGWSIGLMIEVGFFVPAGILLLVFARRLGRSASSPPHAARAEPEAIRP
jgi:hypothetical protein